MADCKDGLRSQSPSLTPETLLQGTQQESLSRKTRAVHVLCLPSQENTQSSFHQHQMKVKEDAVRILQQEGVRVVETLSADKSSVVLILFQSSGRIGDELPHALEGVKSYLQDRDVILAVIQDDDWSRVREEVLPNGFSPKLLLDFCVIPMQCRLKESLRNGEALRDILAFVTSDGSVAVGLQ